MKSCTSSATTSGATKPSPAKTWSPRIRQTPKYATTHERLIRAKINELRKAGQLILSTGGREGGYWLAADLGEVQAFIAAEIEPRAFDLLETKKAILTSAHQTFGETYQPSLFG